jgi:hypothetical protein
MSIWAKRQTINLTGGGRLTKAKATTLRKGDCLIMGPTEVLTLTAKPHSLTVEGLWVVCLDTIRATNNKPGTVFVR